MGGFSFGQIVMIAVIAYAGVWAIDKGLTVAGLGAYSVGK